jgi:DNA-binding NarL/FixJ family response regulator
MAETNDLPVLSPRQKEVLEALSRGLTNDDIARQYNLSRAAIKFHLLELYRKLNVSNRTEAVSIAMKRHLLGD